MDVFHDDRVLVLDVVEDPNDSAVLDLIKQGELLDQLVQRRGICRVLELLDGDEAAAARLAPATGDFTHTQVHGTEVPRSQLADDLVGADEA